MTGTVRMFNSTYGFIEGDDGNDAFVHHSAIDMEGFRTLEPGQRVEFDVIPDNKGPKAANVRVIG